MDKVDFLTLTVDQQREKMTEVAHQALPLWGFENARLELIKFRENAVFKLIDGDEQSVLRVHRLGYHEDDELRSEIQWMRALTDYGVATPDIINSVNGSPFELIDAEGVFFEGNARPFQVDVLAFIDGNPIGTIEGGVDEDESVLASIYHQIGVIAAKAHNQSEAWKKPEGFVRHAWDQDGLTGDDPFWGQFWEFDRLSSEQRDLMLAVRQKLGAALSDMSTEPDVYGLVHADFLPENFLLGSDGTIRLIDFDDAGYGWHLFDFATTLFFHLGEPHYEVIYNALVEGYRTERALSDEHLAKLDLFLLARGTTYLGWMHTRGVSADVEEIIPALIEGVCGMAEELLSERI